MPILEAIFQRERTLFVLMGFILLFLMINFNPMLAIIYFSFILLEFNIFTTDRNPELNTERRTDNRGQALLEAIIYYLIFLVISSVIFSFLKPAQTFSLQAIMQATASTTPIFANSIILSIFAWGFLVAAIETKYFIRFGEFLAEKLGIDLRDWKGMIFIIFLISFAFVIFHLSVKGITDTFALILTFIFMVYTWIIVLIKKEKKQAIFLHIILNTVAVLVKFGIILK